MEVEVPATGLEEAGTEATPEEVPATGLEEPGAEATPEEVKASGLMEVEVPAAGEEPEGTTRAEVSAAGTEAEDLDLVHLVQTVMKSVLMSTTTLPDSKTVETTGIMVDSPMVVGTPVEVTASGLMEVEVPATGLEEAGTEATPEEVKASGLMEVEVPATGLDSELTSLLGGGMTGKVEVPAAG